MLADGKLYIGTETGTFFIVRPVADRAEILSQVTMPVSTNSVGGSEGTAEQIVSGVAISRGRVFFMTSDAVYAIGPKTAKTLTGFATEEPALKGEGAATHVQVSPTELTLAPGQTAKLRVRLFDDKGRFLREDKATWSLEGLKGTVTDGAFTAAPEPVDQAGLIKATVGGVTGQARARIVRPLPWTENFEGFAEGSAPAGWISMVTGKFTIAAIGGQKALHKPPDNTLFKRIRAFMGSTAWSNYTVEADVQTPTRRRQQGDIGITAQRLLADSLRHVAAPEARAVGARDDADGDGAVRVETGHVVSPEAARREPADRRGARARQGLADRRRGAGGVADRQDRSDRQPAGRAGHVHRRRVRRAHRQRQRVSQQVERACRVGPS